MGFCPNCGSYVSPGTNVCSCGTTFGYSSAEPVKEKEPSEYEKQTEAKRKVVSGYYQQAKKLMDEGRYLEAIEYLDKAHEISKNPFYIICKAKAYYYAGMYEEALPLFKKSITSRHFEKYIAYEWIGVTLIGLNRFDEAIQAYRKAIDIINEDYERSINYFKKEIWLGYERIESACNSLEKERSELVCNVEDRIAYALELKRKALAQPENDGNSYLRNMGGENLVTIAGTSFYTHPKFVKGMKFLLQKEIDNKYDKDAIAVYFKGKKVGYVANSFNTNCELTTKASNLEIPFSMYAEYVCYYDGRYHVARIMR